MKKAIVISLVALLLHSAGGLVFAQWGNYNFAWGALIAIGLAAFTLQWLMDESPPRQHVGLVPA